MKAIVYVSNTGHTERYAKMLGERVNLPVYSLADAKAALNKKDEIIFMGWLFASSVKGYKKAARRFKIAAVCAVGLCDTGALLSEVRKAISLPESTPLFTLQGGINRAELRGLNRSMIDTLEKFFKKKANPSTDDKRMLELLASDQDYVSEQNLAAVLEWYSEKSGTITQTI